jgi:hypothetical protein
VRTVTRTVLTSGAMLIGVAAAAAQAPAPRPAVLFTEVRPTPFVGPTRSPNAVIERLVSFDANADQRISPDELPERMQGLVARGDKNADAALDPDEIRALVHAALSPPTKVSFRSQPSEGLSGVINDLKLPPEKHARAVVILSLYKLPRGINDPASSALLDEMETVLDDEEYEDFVAAASRLSRSADIRFRTFGGVVGGVKVPPPSGSR